MSHHIAATPAPTAADLIAGRRKSLQRAYQRLLGRKPNLIQSTLIGNAASTQARFDIAALDPAIKPNDLVRLSGAARHAYRAMTVAFGIPEKPKPVAAPAKPAQTLADVGVR